jgi:hypothetical protein
MHDAIFRDGYRPAYYRPRLFHGLVDWVSGMGISANFIPVDSSDVPHGVSDKKSNNER